MKKLIFLLMLLATPVTAASLETCVAIADFTAIIAISRDAGISAEDTKQYIVQSLSTNEATIFVEVSHVVDSVYNSSLSVEALGSLAYTTCMEE